MTDDKSEKWIITYREKTKTQVKVPLLKIALDNLEKYARHPLCSGYERVLPLLSNQKTNNHLKEIATACNIVKQLTFHIARHTFAKL